MHERTHYLSCALECEEAARRSGPDEERTLLFLARRFRLLAEHAGTAERPSEDEPDDERRIAQEILPSSRPAPA